MFVVFYYFVVTYIIWLDTVLPYAMLMLYSRINYIQYSTVKMCDEVILSSVINVITKKLSTVAATLIDSNGYL